MPNEINEIKTNKLSTIYFKQRESANNDKKKFLNATNLILGSLATIGVLGAADILLCKGKHINKLSGKNRELEETITRATNAETRANNAETELTINKNMLNFLKENLGLRNDNIRDLERAFGATGIENIPRGKSWLRMVRDLYAGVDGFKQLDSKNQSRLLEWLDTYGYKFIDHKSSEYMEYSTFFRESKANVKEQLTSVPILINTRTKECVVPDGIIIKPLK